MLRDFFTNKWALGGIGYLFVFSVACVLWYQYDIADERKAALDAKELLRKSELSHQEIKESEMSSVVGEVADITSAESTTPNAEKSITETTIKAEYTRLSDAREKQSEQTQETAEAVRVSPYGFGRYPEVPSDYPTNVIWNNPGAKEHLPDHALKGIELIDRVLVKLWIEGDKNFRGGCTDNGKVYPYYHNTVYVRYAQQEMPDGTYRRYVTSYLSSPDVEYEYEDLMSDTPPVHLRILELDSTGIDSYQFLNLH